MPKGQRILVWGVIVSQFGPAFMFSGVAVALPSMGADLNAGAVSLGLVEMLFLAGSVAFLLPIGRLADAGDKNTLYKVGMLGFGLSSLLIAAVSSMPLILIIRFLQGLFSAIFTATGPAILADIVPAEQRGKAYGSSLGAIYAGLLLGPVCGGFLSDHWGWRAVFLAGGLVLLLVYVFIFFLLPSKWRSPGKAIHLPSALLMIVAVLSLVGGSSLLHLGWPGYALLSLGVLLAVGFVRLQKNVKRPLLDIPKLMAHRVLRNALCIQMLLYMNAFSSIFLLSLYMQISLGHPAQTSGQVLAFGSVLMAVVAPISGMLSDRFRPRVITAVGVASVLVSMLLAVNLGAETGLLFVALVIAAHGLGFALFASPNMTLIMNSVPPEAFSMASALASKARSLGMVIGMMITTFFISRSLGNDPVAQHPLLFIDIMRTVFTILAVLAAGSLAFAVLARDHGPEAEG